MGNCENLNLLIAEADWLIDLKVTTSDSRFQGGISNENIVYEITP